MKSEISVLSCFSSSVITHGGILIALALSNPNPLWHPEGTTESIEITTISAPKGNQVEKAAAEIKEDTSPKQAKEPPKVEVEEQIVVAKPKPKPKPKAKPKVKKEIVKKFPEKAPMVEPEPAKLEDVVVKKVDVIEEEPKVDEPTEEIANDDGFEDLDEEETKEVIKEEVIAENLDEKVIKPAPAKVKENTKPAVAAAPRVEAPAEKPGPQQQKGKVAGAKGKVNKADMNHGVPSGTRRAMDLRQNPGNVPPQYPYQSRLKKHQGVTRLLYYVTPEGRVQNLKVIKSSGYKELDLEARRAILKYRFYPGQQGYTVQNVNYRLMGKAKEIPSGLRRKAQL